MFNENIFKAMVDCFPCSAFITDENLRMIYANKYMQDTFLKEKDWLNKLPEDLFPKGLFSKGLIEQFMADSQKALDEGFQKITETVTGKDGVTRNYKTIKFPIYRKDKPLLIGCIATDITEIINTKKVLETNEEKFREIVNQNFDIIMLTYMDSKIFYISPSIERITGYSPNEMIGKFAIDFADEASVPAALEGYKVIASGKSVTGYLSIFTHKNGKNIYLESNASPIYENKKIIGAHVIMRNITERRTAQKALKENEKKYRSIFNMSENFIVIVDKNETIVDCNSKSEKLFGYFKDEMIGMPLSKTMHYDSYARAKYLLNKVLIGEIVDKKEIKMVRKNGKYIDVVVNCSGLKDQNGVIVKAICTIDDITAKRKMEKELLNTKKLESIGILTGGIAHDYNNLLAAILGNISLAQMFLEPYDKVSEFLNNAENASNQARDLTKKLFLFSRGALPNKKVIPIEPLLKNEADFLFKNSDVIISYFIQDGLWNAIIDERQIGQTLRNILINAQESMIESKHKKENIVVRAENVRIGKEENVISLLSVGNYVKISIEDEGSGIAEENLPKIFDPYFSTKAMGTQKGMGLNLAICHSIVKKHGGNITVSSNVGFGSIFSIYLPAVAKEIADTESLKVKTVKSDSEAKGKILVMDDERMVGNTLLMILNHLKYDAYLAINGAEAISVYEKSMKSGNPFDAVILDLCIEKGMGGRETLQKLIDIDSDIKGIVFSGYSNDPAVMNFKEYGFVDMIPKPFNPDTVDTVLKNVLVHKSSKK